MRRDYLISAGRASCDDGYGEHGMAVENLPTKRPAGNSSRRRR